MNASRGVKIKSPSTVECEACALAKIKKQIRCYFRTYKHVGERIAVDFHDYIPEINGYISQMLLTNRNTSYVWNYYLVNRIFQTLIKTFRSFFGIMTYRYDLVVKVIECDNEIIERNLKVAEFLKASHIKLKPSAPNTQD
jgi:hypothetical protein